MQNERIAITTNKNVNMWKCGKKGEFKSFWIICLRTHLFICFPIRQHNWLNWVVELVRAKLKNGMNEKWAQFPV